MHAALEFGIAFPDEYQKWHSRSNSIITLATKNERALWEFSRLLEKKGLKYVPFYEPDVGMALTALAIVPNPMVKRVCMGIPLCGKYVNPLAQERLEKTWDLVEKMQTCYQTKGINMLEHGLMVKDRLFDLLETMRDPSRSYRYQWRLPSWFLEHSAKISKDICSDFTLAKYTTMHDCGKPKVRIEREDGKASYPNHAEASYEEWLSISDDAEIAELIRRDMQIHLLKSEEIPEFCRNKKTALSLLISGLAEIHANEQLFGGFNSDGFKIKWKQIDKKGKGICQFLFGWVKVTSGT